MTEHRSLREVVVRVVRLVNQLGRLGTVVHSRTGWGNKGKLESDDHVLVVGGRKENHGFLWESPSCGLWAH